MHGVGLVHRDVKLESSFYFLHILTKPNMITDILLTTPIFAALAQTQTPTLNSQYTDITTISPVSDSDTRTSTRAPTLDDLPPPPAPLIKLTDFGLSRFVDIRTEEEKRRDREARRRTRALRMRRTASEASTGDSSADEEDKNRPSLMEERPRGALRAQPQQGEDGEEEGEEEEEYEGPLLSTRCGSEAYAAPELVMGGGRAAGKGVYDARETDAWACGVVLYALVGRRLPFGEGVGAGAGAGIRGEGADRGGGVGPSGRRQWLMRIARGEYEWPVFEPERSGEGEGEELIGKRLVESAGARRIVEKLLVRDPRKRTRVGELWGDEWMSWGEDRDADGDGDGGVGDVDMDVRGDVVEVDRIHEHEHEHEHDRVYEHVQDHDPELDRDAEYDFCQPDAGVSEEEEELETEMEMEMAELEEEEEHADGWIVDQDGIDSIARREVV